MYELPGGSVDTGEDPQVAAVRELYEETGYRAGPVTYLGKAYKDAHCNMVWHFYLATDCQLDTAERQAEPGEFIEVKLISIADLFEHALAGRMTDTEAVFLAYEQLKKMQEST
jgi:ADP-ribose pyrophosphatase